MWKSMQEESVFKKNLAALSQRSPLLAAQLGKLPVSADTSVGLAPNQQANMLYRNVAVHSDDPAGESANLLATEVPADVRTYRSVFFIIGMGLGYLLRRSFVTTAARLVVYEPLIDVLRQTLEIVDLSEELASERVSIVNDIYQVRSAFEENLLDVNDFRAMVLPSYQSIAPRQLKAAVEAFRTVLGEKDKLQDIIDAFHTLAYNKVSHPSTGRAPQFMGIEVWKMPTDLWMYQELIFETKPDLIIETGTALGGSGLYLASLCDMVNCGKVVSIDIVAHPNRPTHPRLTHLMGSSTAPHVVDQIKAMIADPSCNKVMAILDSDHAQKHVIEELRIYGELVTKGCYLIVEDSNVNGHPVKPEFGPGPKEAVDVYLLENPNYMINAYCERFLLSQNPEGYLLRVN